MRPEWVVTAETPYQTVALVRVRARWRREHVRYDFKQTGPAQATSENRAQPPVCRRFWLELGQILKSQESWAELGYVMSFHDRLINYVLVLGAKPQDRHDATRSDIHKTQFWLNRLKLAWFSKKLEMWTGISSKELILLL